MEFNTGIIIQFGIKQQNVDAVSISWPLSFTNTNYIAFAYGKLVADTIVSTFPTKTISGASGNIYGTGNVSMSYFCIGY